MVILYKKKGTRKCYNCQLFNDSWEDCYWKSVWMECAESRKTKDCSITDKSGIKCANCGDKHTANYLGCPANLKKFKNKSRVTTITWVVSCRIKASCPILRHRPVGEVSSVWVFLKDPNPYLWEFGGKPRKTPNG